jgi:hypothetical protein
LAVALILNEKEKFRKAEWAVYTHAQEFILQRVDVPVKDLLDHFGRNFEFSHVTIHEFISIHVTVNLLIAAEIITTLIEHMPSNALQIAFRHFVLELVRPTALELVSVLLP